MSKRSMMLWGLLSVGMTILLEVVSSQFINYNFVLRLVTGIIWLFLILLSLGDIYWITKKEFVNYHSISVKTMISFIMVILFTCSVFFCKNVNSRLLYLDLLIIALISSIHFFKKLLNYDIKEN